MSLNGVFTFEHGGQFPHTKPSDRCVLTERRLKKEQGHSSEYEGQKVGNQEGPWMKGENVKVVWVKRKHKPLNMNDNPHWDLGKEDILFHTAPQLSAQACACVRAITHSKMRRKKRHLR